MALTKVRSSELAYEPCQGEILGIARAEPRNSSGLLTSCPWSDTRSREPGLDPYKTVKANPELALMLANGRRARVTFPGSIRYGFQRFCLLNKARDVGFVVVGLGF